MFVIPQPPRISSDLREKLRRLSDSDSNVLEQGVSPANENVFSSLLVMDRRPLTRNAALLAAQNNVLLVEGRPENVYGEDCVSCRETYREMGMKGRGLVPYGVRPSDDFI